MTPRLPKLNATRKPINYSKVVKSGKTKALWNEQFRDALLLVPEEQRAEMWEKYLTRARIKRNEIRAKNLAKRAKK